jgi:hypothetical protein
VLEASGMSRGGQIERDITFVYKANADSVMTAEITPAKAQIPFYVVENFECLERKPAATKKFASTSQSG